MLSTLLRMIRIFTMTDADCDRVADFIRERVLNCGYTKKIGGLVTAENLRSFKDLKIELAEIDGKLVGHLSWEITHSTWRGVKGLYVNDHYALDSSVRILNELLKHTIAKGLGLGVTYIRTEVDITDDHVTEAYTKAGFWHAVMRAQYYLEPQAFSDYVQKMKIEPVV